MRLTQMLLKNFKSYKRGNKVARAPQDLKAIPFDAILPLRLRDRGLKKKLFLFFIFLQIL